VLVNGAAGGVGTFAIQLPRVLGANVTGVCSTRNLDLVRSIGADHVIDYTAGDFTTGDRRYDLIVQVSGNRTRRDMRRVLAPRGAIVVVGAGTGRDTDDAGGLLELVSLMLKGVVLSRFMRPRESMFIARMRRADLTFLADLIADGRVKPVIDRTYPLAEAADAMRYLEGGHARGKVIVHVA
jgi:NADPH:quinone reductase-like Zn-dependent oxidoreductase